MWDFLQPYTPTAAGAIERFNGLLKHKLLADKHPNLQMAIDKAVYELNLRPRLHRASPYQEALHLEPEIIMPKEDNRTLIKPYSTIYRNPKDKSLQPAEILAQGEGNNAWITQAHGDLRLVRLEDLA